jgi:hypothetical protein
MVEAGALVLRQRVAPPLDVVAVVSAPEQMVAGRLVEIARPRSLVEPVSKRPVVRGADRPVCLGASHRFDSPNLQPLGDVHPIEPMLAAFDPLGRLGGVLLLAIFTLGRLLVAHSVKPSSRIAS